MVRLLRPWIFTCLIFLRLGLAWAETAQPEFYLSFEQRLLLSYALEAKGMDDTHRAELAQRILFLKNKYLNQGARVVQVKNFEEFLTLYRGQWPNTQSLDLDLKIIEAQSARGLLQFKSENSRIQRKIDNYIATANAELFQKAQKVAPSLFDPKNFENTKNIATFFENTTESGPATAPALAVAKVAMDISEKILTDQLNELDKIGEEITQHDLNIQGDGSLKILLETMFTEYFKRLSPESKKQIMSAFVGEDLHCNNLRKFEMMLQNSGPQLQKLLQAVASEKKDLTPEMLAIFKRLENSVREVPWLQVKAMLDAEKANYEFIYFERKPLGVGTMAQVHRAKILWKGQKKDVVVRFIKPDIEKRVLEDDRILSEVAVILDSNPAIRKLGIPRLAPLVADITKTVTAELDQSQTISRQKMGQKFYEHDLFFDSPSYKNTLKIHVPELYLSQNPSQFMVQEMVIGSKLDKEAKVYESSIPDLKRVISEEIAAMWVQEVMFGSGFFHSDLHQGNFMVHVTDPEIKVSILDYGMGGVLSKPLRERVITLGAGLDLLNSDLIARSFLAISNRTKNSISPADFTKEVHAKVANINKGWEPRLGIDRWTSWALDQGLHLPYEFINLNRGVVIVTKMLADSGSKENMTSLTKKVAMKNPIQSYEILRNVGGLSMPEMAKLAWIQLAGKNPIQKQTAARCESFFLEVGSM